MDSQEEEKVKWHIVSAFVFYNKKITKNFFFTYGRFSHCLSDSMQIKLFSTSRYVLLSSKTYRTWFTKISVKGGLVISIFVFPLYILLLPQNIVLSSTYLLSCYKFILHSTICDLTVLLIP